MKTEPSYYREARALAFNVKTHGLRWAEGGDDRQREAAWETALQYWWMDAKLLAIKHGFQNVYAYGRSGGWLVPVPGVDPDDESIDPDGYSEALARIRAFGEELNDLFKQAPEYFNSALTAELAHAARPAPHSLTVVEWIERARDTLAKHDLAEHDDELIDAHADLCQALSLLRPER